MWRCLRFMEGVSSVRHIPDRVYTFCGKKTTKQRRKVCSCDDVLHLCLVDYFPRKACLQAPVHFSKYMSVNILPAGVFIGHRGDVRLARSC